MMLRGKLTSRLWSTLWFLSAALIIQGALEVFELGARWPVWLLSVAPLLLFLIGVARDSLHWLIWYCLLLLFYFISAVEDTFARPDNLIVVSGLVIVVLLFSTCTAYIRFRGREKRAFEEQRVSSE
jgi:uncharacterized membrane protein